MSRIAAVLALDGQSSEACSGLAAAMAQRLPGKVENVLAGARGAVARRAVLDAQAAMATADGLLLALDGQLFNREEVAELGGGMPKDASDAQILLRAAQRRGIRAAVSAANGDFAVALLDNGAGTLTLARDRLGIKPLYYALGRGWAAAASQPRALLGVDGVMHGVNRRYAALVAASHYRSFDMVPEESPYAGISQVVAGTLVMLDRNGARRENYWAIEGWEPFQRPEAELAEEYRALLADAVGRRVRIAGNAAFTLSGGMDSSSVLCNAVAETGRRMDAYSSVYVDPMYDEREEIRDLLADKVGTWHPVEIGNNIDVFGMVKQLVAVHEEPVATATWLSHEIVCRQVSADGFTSLFGGLGGDELNAGEYEYFPFFFADLAAAGKSAQLEREIRFWSQYHDHPIYKKDAEAARRLMASLTDPDHPGSIRLDRQRYRRYAKVLDPAWYDLDRFMPPMDGPFRTYLYNRCYQDLVRETTPCCLRAEDRQCTAHGLTHYDPFLDHRLVEFMFRVPPETKIRDGVTKHLLRAAMKGILPEGTRTRVKKTGWNAPAHRWFSGEGLEMIRDIVQSESFRSLGVYRVPEVLNIIDDHKRIVESGAVEENHMMFLWQLVNVYFWLSQCG